jgi:hypothetical protein
VADYANGAPSVTEFAEEFGYRKGLAAWGRTVFDVIPHLLD